MNHLLISILDILTKKYIHCLVDVSLWNRKSFYMLMFFAMNEMKELMLNFIDFEKNIKNHSNVRQRYYYHLRMLNEYLIFEKWANVQVEDIELTDILDFLNKYKLHKIQHWPTSWKYPSINAVYNMIVSIRMFFRYCNIIWKHLRFNREQIPICKMEDVKREPMKKEDYEILYKAPILYNDLDRQDVILRDRLIFQIPRETGLRRAELTRLKFEHFHSPNRQFQIEVKWWRYESVFFSERLQKKVFEYEDVIRKKYRWYKDMEYLFFYMSQKQVDKWRQMSPKVLWLIVWDYVKKLKKDWLIPENKKLCLHQERHSFAMRCVYSWLSQQATTQLMRHKDPKITLHYYHLNDTRLKNQYDLIQ